MWNKAVIKDSLGERESDKLCIGTDKKTFFFYL